MTASFVCVACRRPVSSRWDQFVERTEYRRIDGGKRFHGPPLRDLCRDCVEALVARHPSSAQETLL